MKYIELTQGKQAIVDDEDFEWLTQWKWHYKDQPGGGYASRNTKYIRGTPRTVIRMHRFIMNTPKGLETDHKNGNKLDNRRSNLRIATKGQNQWNRKKQKGSSRYKGVYWNKKNQRWHVQLQFHKKKIWLGYYKAEKEAQKAYEEGVVKFYGEFARLN